MDLQFLADGSPPRVLECVQTSTVCRGIHRIYICTFVHLEYLLYSHCSSTEDQILRNGNTRCTEYNSIK